MKRTILSLCAGVCVLSVSAFASTQDPYYTIDSVEIKQVQDEGFGSMGNLDRAEDAQLFDLRQNVLGGSSTIVVIDQIINLGRKVWGMIEKNRPVVDYKTDYVTALPKGVQSAWELNGWRTPETAVYEVSYKNVFRMTTIRYRFRVIYTWGGSYQGQGRYLANVSVYPAHLYVAWGYKFNSDVTFPQIINTGTSSSPVASVQGQVGWTVDTVMNHVRGSASFMVKGNGAFKNLE